MRASARLIVTVAAALSAAILNAPVALADHPQPPRDISKLDYSPQGFFKAGDPVPLGNACKTSDLFTSRMNGRRFNPSGKYNAFDTNVFEVFCLPFREAGDESAADELGGGDGSDPARGFCAGRGTSPPQPGPEAPLSVLAGRCPNHQLEYVDYYEETMRDILGDFGVELKRYEFEHEGSGNTFGGRAINPAAVVPGADHPEDTVIIGAHYDQTTEGPASAWDSAEGHAQVIRVAKLMADYWKATGTRPSATVKFIPWDGEESGTLGSLDYTENNIVPGQEGNVRGYWNTDPCAGGYPAFRNGNPNQRITLGIQVARPAEVPGEYDVARVEAFNDRAADVVEQVFDKLDDSVPVAGGTREVFISMSEAGQNADTANGSVTISGERPLLFSSDWANFLDKGVPFFNPGPEVTGPGDDGGTGNPDGLAILHTPNDNIVTLNRMTSPDLTGGTFSAGWMKGMEMCANLLAWGMLREDQGGAQAVNGDVVAYYEALPNEAPVNKPVVFDARGSYEYDDPGARTLVPGDRLEYEWDFGDGTTGSGQKVQHSYATAGRYTSVLTVRDKVSGETDTHKVPITVVGAALAGPALADAPAEDADGTFELSWEFDEAVREGFASYRVEEAGDAATPLEDPAETLDRWSPSEPTEPTIQQWQLSDQASSSVRGNVHHSGDRGFYTGIGAEDQQPGVGPASGVSVLELKDPVALDAPGTLSYWSSFANDVNDEGRVEVAVADGEPQWKTVDTLVTGENDYYTLPTDAGTYPSTMRLRTVDLSPFTGKRVRIRFVYALGPTQYVNVLRTGWYVDDIRVDTGTYSSIGEPTAKAMTVTGKTAGTYAYRVLAKFADGETTAASNVEVVRVTQGAPGGPGTGGPGAGGPGTGGPGTGGCARRQGPASVEPVSKGRRLRFAVAAGTSGPVSIDVLRHSRGRRVVGPRKVASFSRSTSFTLKGRRLKPGIYTVRMRGRTATGEAVSRRVALVREAGRFRRLPAYTARNRCGRLRAVALNRPVFGGSDGRPLKVAFALERESLVRVDLLRGKRAIRVLAQGRRPAEAVQRLRIKSRGLRRGTYRVRVTLLGGERETQTVAARRI
jgi:PKD repeat protein